MVLMRPRVDRLLRACALLSAAWVAGHALAQPSFTTLPLSSTGADARAISANGRYVTGASGGRAYVYDTVSQIVTNYPTATNSYGSGVLDDGRVFGLSSNRPFRWVPSTGVVTTAQPYPTLPDGTFQHFGVARDGSFSVGSVGTSGGGRPYYVDWVNALAWDMSIGSFPQGNSPSSTAKCVAINSTGTYFYGSVIRTPSNQSSGARWRFGLASSWYDWTPGKYNEACTPTGDYVVSWLGFSDVAQLDGPSGTTILQYPGGTYLPIPRGISDDASVIGGTVRANSGNFREDAIIWNRAGQPQYLRTMLTNAGVSVPAWAEAYIYAVSGDGASVVGTYRTTTSSPTQAFVANLPLPNETCDTATTITYGTTYGSTRTARPVIGGFGNWCGSDSSSGDLWYTLTPASNETVVIDTCGSDFDTTLSVWTSCSSGGGPLVCNDQWSGCTANPNASQVTFNAFGGFPYKIRVAGWNGARGNVQLNVRAPNRPVNDECGNALTIDPGFRREFNTTGALTDSRPTCPGNSNGLFDVWFKTTAPDRGRIVFDTCGGTMQTVISVYNANACSNPNAQPISCAVYGCGGVGSRAWVSCEPGQQFLIRVGGLFGTVGTSFLQVTYACDDVNFDAYRGTVMADAPLAYWRFDDSGSTIARDQTVNDPLSCGRFPGTYDGNVQRPAGLIGRAMQLDRTGSMNRSWAPDPSPANSCNGASPGNWTMEAWIKTTDPIAGVIMTQRNQETDFSPTLLVGYNPIGPSYPGRVIFVNDGPGTFTGLMSDVRVDDGQWHHVMGVRSARSILGFTIWNYILYVDGVPQGSPVTGVGSIVPPPSNGDWWWNVGTGPAWGGGVNFRGMIDEAAIYCQALSTDRAWAHWVAGSAAICDDLDFNNDGLFPDTLDLEDLIGVLAGGPTACSNYPNCQDVDFNNDGFFPDSLDLDAYINRLAGGPCLR